MKKKLLSALLSVAMVAALVAGCGSTENTTTEEEKTEASSEQEKTETSAEGGSVYYLNFKPEQDEAWQKLAASYTEQTGVPVTVLTAASGNYEPTLMSEMGKSSAPTLFHVNGLVSFQNWKDYCYDLTDTDICKELSDDAFSIKEDGNVYAIAFAVESYGLITNKTLLEKAGYDVADIDSFEDLKACAEDITARKDELGFSAFASAGMDGSSDWRFKTHLANMAIHFEYADKGISSTDAIEGTYLDNYRAMWDLYINNSTCDPTELSAKMGDDARAEFLAGEAVFYQNGSWEYGNLTGEGGFSEDELVMLPIYFGVGDEAKQGLCTGTENYWCVNAQADEADIQATLEFMNWCVSSEEGTTAMANDMGFVIPFKNALESPNLFMKQGVEYVEEGKSPISWDFTSIPSEEWKNGVGSALTAYAADQTDANWDAVVSAFVDGWASEWALLDME